MRLFFIQILNNFKEKRKKLSMISESFFNNNHHLQLRRCSVIRILGALLLLTFASIILLGIWVDSSRWSRWKVYNLINSGLSADGHFEPLLSRFGSAQSANYRSKSSLSFKYSSSELNFLTWSPKDKPWFMVNGSLIPNPNEITFSRLSLLPEDDEPWNDRIINQLMYIPQGYQSDQLKKDDLKKILLHFDKSSWGQELPIGQDIFLQDLCPVNTCEITFDNRQASTADAILFKVSSIHIH